LWPLWVVPAVAAAAMEQQRGKRGAAGTGDVDHTVAAVLLSPAGASKDAHPDQEADSQEVAASAGAWLRHICISGCNWWYDFYYSLSILDSCASFFSCHKQMVFKAKASGLIWSPGVYPLLNL